MSEKNTHAPHRRAKLKKWVAENGVPADGRSYFSQLLNSKVAFGEKAARNLEKKYNMPPMYLDTEDDLEQDSVTLRQFDYAAACGSGIVNSDYPELIRSIEIPKERIGELFGLRSLDGIDIITISGDSMAPTIPQKALALIDTRVHEFTRDGIYIFVLHGAVYMKRLQRMPGFIRAKSDNSFYDDIDIYPEKEQENFQIAARFIGVFPLNMIEL